MSTTSGVTHGTSSNAVILDKLINEISPRSFSSNELDEIVSLSDASIDTNGNLVKHKMPVWPRSDDNRDDAGDANVQTNGTSNTDEPEPLSEEEKATAAVEAAAAAADALGKDLEAMGYDLECRSFIKKRGEDSFTAQSFENEKVERYTSTNTIAPFSEEEVNNNNNDVLKLLRSTSDLIEATRSSSDLIVALRSRSSEEQIDAIDPILSIVSNGTGPMMIPEAATAAPRDHKDLDNTSRKSYGIIQAQPSNKSSQTSVKSHRSQKSTGNNKVSSNSAHSSASVKSQRSHKTTSSRRRSKFQIEQLAKEQMDQGKLSEPVVVETVTSIPSTLSQLNVQYTTTNSDDGNEPLKLMASPSQQQAMKNSLHGHGETVIVSHGTKIEHEGPVEVADAKSIGIAKKDRKTTKAKGTAKNLETGSYHVTSKLQSQPSPLQSSQDESSESLPKILRSTSEGGNPSNRKIRLPPQRHVRNSGIPRDGTVKSKSSYWSARGESRKSRVSRNTNKSHSPQENDDEASEVSSIASSRVAPPFPILSIPMKNTKKKSSTVDEGASNNSQRPPLIPKVSSQRSTVSVTSKKANGDVIPEQGYIETKRSVDSRTMDEMSPEGMEMTAIVKNDNVAVTPLIDAAVFSAPSVESKTSSRKILKSASKGAKVTLPEQNIASIETSAKTTLSEPNEKLTNAPTHIISPKKEDVFGITSNLSGEDDNEQKAKEQEQIARQMILANMIERQRRIRRSIHARDTLLKLVHQKTGDDKLESMTLPPTFENTNPSMRSSAKSAPANVDYIAPLIVPATTTSICTMPLQANPSNTNSKNVTSPTNSDFCDETIVSDSTPKVRGGARIFNFLSFSPEKRSRVAKVNKEQHAPQSKIKLIPMPSFGRRSKKGQAESSKRGNNHRRLFHITKNDASKHRAGLFSMKKKEDVAPVTPVSAEEIPESNDIESSTPDVPIANKKPKVTYVDLDDSFEAIEVAFSKSPDSFSSKLPPMLGTDTVLEKIMEEGSCDDVKSLSSNPDDAPVYSVQPLMISPVRANTNLMNEDMLALTRKAAIEDLKKVGADMIASTTDIPTRHNGEHVIKERIDLQPKQQQATVSFFSAVDKWFFEPLSRSTTVSKTTEMEKTDKATDVMPTTVTDKVFAGLALSTAREAETQSVLPQMSNREKTLEYLDQELKSREENSLKSISELEERIMDGLVDYNRTVPTHLILNNANDDDGSCITALNSTLTRTLPLKNNNNFSRGKDDVSTLSDVLTMDQWHEIAEAAYTVERALKNIEQSGGIKSSKSDANNSKPSLTFINDEVEDALHILSKHAARLGVSESDILMALGGSSYDDETDVETLDPSILAQQLSRSPGPRAAKRQMHDDDGETATLEDGTTNSLTIGEEILQVLQMYMAKK